MDIPKTELTDPESWAEVLQLYAGAMNIAIAMTDLDGQLVGVCHNPQPIWTLVRSSAQQWEGSCPFCMDSSEPCTSVADARRTGDVVLVHDRAGFAHVAVPLALGERHIGTLLAGQVFDQYPEPLAIDRLARTFNLSPQRLWNIARYQVPVSRSSLGIFGSLLLTLGRALLGQRYSIVLKRELAAADAELQSANRELKQVNLSLQANVDELRKSNGEKSVLLQEVHHRVNNNLQVIASLLRLQSRSLENSHVQDALHITGSRVEAMAMIHAQLYEAADLRQVDFAKYASRLMDNLLHSYGVEPERISSSVAIGPLKLPVDQAIPVGLILNELISNAIKYAFPDLRRGSIGIEGGLHGEQVELAFRDDGVGFVPPPESRQGKSHGLHIVSILCGQLHATLERTHSAGVPGPGTTFKLAFPLKTPVRES